MFREFCPNIVIFFLPLLDFDMTNYNVSCGRLAEPMSWQKKRLYRISTPIQITYMYVTHVMCELLLRHNGRPNSLLIRQKHEMIRKCPMSNCYFQLCIIV